MKIHRGLYGLLFASLAIRAADISIHVDATDVDHRVFAVHETIPVTRGPLTLLYPQWIPGNHAPSGRPWQIAGLHVTAGGQEIRWQRDPVNVYAFHVDVPAGVAQVEVDFQYLSALQASQGPLVSSPELFTMAWNYVVLYPAGSTAEALRMRPSLKVPAGWDVASSLQVAAREADTVRFEPVSLRELVDSPAWAGRYAKRIPLDPATAVSLDVFADMAEHLPTAEEHLAPFRAMTTQAYAAFGAPPYRHYDVLLALHEQIYSHGLEHQSSTEITMPSAFFTRWKAYAQRRGVFAHEFTHAWIGKKHRPADLATPDFNTPMQGSLLWVYEGETDYWGWVLAARSGFHTEAQAHDLLARTAASLSTRAGRAWRDLQDTTNEPAIRHDRMRDWTSWQRGADYYGEAGFLWLEVDARLRELTQGQRSLDDFARGFHGAAAQRPEPVVTYVFDDVVRALDAVAHDDWRTFLRERLGTHSRDTAAGALKAAGWHVTFSEKPSELQETADQESGGSDFSYSLGFAVGRQDLVTGVQWDGPAFRAGLSPNATLLAVNGHAYKADLLKLAIESAKISKATIALLVKSGDLYRTIEVDYHQGLRYPHLERIEGAPDRLADILRTRTGAASTTGQ